MYGESDKCDGISMDSLITGSPGACGGRCTGSAEVGRPARRSTSARATRHRDGAARRPTRAKQLLRSAARAFGPNEATAHARCVVAEAEIALVSRNLQWAMRMSARRVQRSKHTAIGGSPHAGYLEARRLLLIGRLDESERTLDALDVVALPQTSRTGYWLVAAGIAMRRIRAKSARAALDRAGHAARETGIPSLAAEVTGRHARSMHLPRA